jgi:flagellar FliL protein
VANTETTAPPARQGPSLIVQGAVLLVLTGAAVGAGWFSGQYLNESQGAPPAPQAAKADEEHGGEHGAAEAETAGSVVALPAITTNLAGPGDTWVRMEASLVFDGGSDEEIAASVHQDILAYLRTVKLNQVEGPSGLQHLKTDLEERAKIRSEGKVKSILIGTLLFE